jgi:hypothetical protein
MVTADEIRKRVEAADRARVQSRADAAAAIATAVEQRTKVRAELAELEAAIDTQVKASEAVMSLAELAEFTGIPVTELRATGRGARSGKATRSTSTRGRSARTAGRARTASTTASAVPLEAGGGSAAASE